MSYASAGEISRQIHKLANLCLENNQIDPGLYDVYHVKKGLREPSGKGVLTGLTEISTVNGTREIDGRMTPIEGELYYRGIDIRKLVEGFTEDQGSGKGIFRGRTVRIRGDGLSSSIRKPAGQK